MSEELIARVAAEVDRIVALPLDQQPTAFGLVRDELESVLNGAENSFFDGSSKTGE